MDPFHEGERRVQQRAGQLQDADRNSPMITSRIPGGAIPFLSQQPLLILTVLDKSAMWCLPLAGKIGWMFATSETIELDMGQLLAPIDRRVLNAAEEHQLVGGIVLDFRTRRRLRVNGQIERTFEDLMTLRVREAYPNCPKYITRRELAGLENVPPVSLEGGHSLTRDQQLAFESTDILFIASRHPERGSDASHRGGNPGFVQSPSEREVRFPDYAGNSMFNTFGNLEIDSRAGMLLPDFNRGRALAISGNAAVNYEHDGRNRQMRLAIQRWSWVSLPLIETQRELSPFNP